MCRNVGAEIATAGAEVGKLLQLLRLGVVDGRSVVGLEREFSVGPTEPAAVPVDADQGRCNRDPLLFLARKERGDT